MTTSRYKKTPQTKPTPHQARLLAAPWMAPSVPGAVTGPWPQFIVPLAISEKPLPIRIEWDPEFFPGFPPIVDGDRVQLLLNDAPAGAPYTLTSTDETNGYLFVDLPLFDNDGNDRDNNPQTLSFVLHAATSGEDIASRPATIYIDRTPPGQERLGEVVLPDVTGQVVTPGQLVGDNLRALVPSYFGRWQGDTITPYIQGLSGNADLDASAIQLPTSDNGGVITILYPRAALEAAGDGPALLGYRIKDLAGNESVYAEGHPVVLVLRDAPGDSDLLPPIVPLFDDNDIIDEDDARQLDVEIPLYLHINGSDRIELYWNATAVGTFPITDPTADPIVTIRVPYSVIQASDPGNDAPFTVDVNYKVLRSGYAVATSPATEVVVDIRLPGGTDPTPGTPDHGNLGLPVARSTLSTPVDNVITATQFGQDANIHIPWPASTPPDPTNVKFKAGDVIVADWGGETVSYTVTSSDEQFATISALTLTGQQMVDVGTGNIPLFYTVTRNFPADPPLPAYSNTSTSPTQIVVVQSNIDVPGGGNELPDKGRFTEVNANLALNWANTRQGAPYQVLLNYLNVVPGDTIHFFMEGQTLQGVVLPGTQYDASYIIQQADINRGSYDFRVPATLFTTALWPTNVGAHVVHTYWTATNAIGTGNSGEQVTLIDLRTGLAPATPPAAAPFLSMPRFESDAADARNAEKLEQFAASLWSQPPKA
ncbi:hypothetical protein [Pseudomonas sp. M47T1]|uniref:hypothetical protein n=1 Tax=Pseudomonas sp. M47T1 TaxID=1179778 RepID=UPI0012F96CDC|nr:hypothetical protein [Pseudomonas sp. M47T1]